MRVWPAWTPLHRPSRPTNPLTCTLLHCHAPPHSLSVGLASAAIVLKEPKTLAPWGRFRSGPLNHGFSHASGLGGKVDPQHPPEPALQVRLVWVKRADRALRFVIFAPPPNPYPPSAHPYPHISPAPFAHPYPHISPAPLAHPYPRQWSTDTADGIRSSPVVSGGNVVYFGADDGFLYAVNAGELGAAPADSDGDGFRKKRERTSTPGNVLWKHQTGGKIASSPALSPDDKTVYVGSDDHHLYALDAAAGEVLWKFETGGEVTSSPVVGTGDPAGADYAPVRKVRVRSVRLG